MRRAVHIAILLGLPGLASCGPVSDRTPTPAEAEKEIRAALADWVSATEAGDRHRANRIWAPDMVGYSPGQPLDTYEREVAAESLPARPNGTRIGLTVVEVIVSGDLAVVHDIWRFSRPTPNPAAPDSIRGFEVWRHTPHGPWRITRWLTAPFPK